MKGTRERSEQGLSGGHRSDDYGGYPSFYKENIQDHLMIYAIVGNSKSMDMEKPPNSDRSLR